MYEMRKNLLLLVLVATSFSCGEETSIMLTVDGDLRIGVDVDLLTVEVIDGLGDSEPIRRSNYNLADREPLPHTLLIVPGSQVNDVIQIRVRALLDEEEILVATRRTRFETDQQVAEEICLWQRCLGADSRACDEGLCEIVDTDGDADADGDMEMDGDFEEDGDVDDEIDGDVCIPNCGARECGLDPDCETLSCGECDDNEDCTGAGLCECRFDECSAACCAEGETCSALDGACCAPDCGERNCGLDPICGLVSCGECGDLEECAGEGLCECLYEECTDLCCLEGEVCDATSGACCLPDCGDRECGTDPLCGVGNCGECDEFAGCTAEGRCECLFSTCADACCDDGEVCSTAEVCCVADCGERVCGVDPLCGVTSCGECGDNEACTEDGACECLFDSCEGACCAEDDACVDGACCAPDCGDRACGMDPVCGTLSCGACGDWSDCDDTTGSCDCRFLECEGACCAEDDVCTAEGECCEPDCTDRECGSDGCGGTCGEDCPLGESCSLEGLCIAPDWITVSAGSYSEGSSPFEVGRDPDERPHTVILTHDFEILSTEVTQFDFALNLFYTPSYHSDTGAGAACGFNCPVELVTWSEAAAYCNHLSGAAGHALCYTCTGSGPTVSCTSNAAYPNPYDCPGYRLPTEAEWEFAARAGTATATYAGDLDGAHLECATPNPALDDIAWYCGNGLDITHPIGTREPNDFELFDMLGNVAEWVHDWYADYPDFAVSDPYGPADGEHRVIRGGSYATNARWCRSAFRLPLTPTDRYIDLGFRVARTLP